MAIVGSPAYFEQHAAPKIPTDLIQHNCLAYRLTSSGSIDRWSFTSSNEETRTMVFEPQGNAVFNDDDSMLQGVGWGSISTCACASTWHLTADTWQMAYWYRFSVPGVHHFPGSICMCLQARRRPPRSGG